jgi:hypothetical protein
MRIIEVLGNGFAASGITRQQYVAAHIPFAAADMELLVKFLHGRKPPKIITNCNIVSNNYKTYRNIGYIQYTRCFKKMQLTAKLAASFFLISGTNYRQHDRAVLALRAMMK